MLEITAGVGGQEAMIFTQDLFEMYSSFANFKGWQSEMADYCPTDIGMYTNDKYIISLIVINKIRKRDKR